MYNLKTMEAIITQLLKLYENPRVLEDDKLRTAISDVIKGLSLLVASNKTVKRPSSPCPCGTCESDCFGCEYGT